MFRSSVWLVGVLASMMLASGSPAAEAAPGRIALEENGRVAVLWQGTPVVTIHLRGYGEEWAWMGRHVESMQSADGQAVVEGRLQAGRGPRADFTMTLAGNREGASIRVKVAGDEPMPITGISLTPVVHVQDLQGGSAVLDRAGGSAREFSFRGPLGPVQEKVSWERLLVRIQGGPDVTFSPSRPVDGTLEDERGSLRCRAWVAQRELGPKGAELELRLGVPAEQFEVILDPNKNVLDYVGEDWFQWSPPWTDYPVDVSFLNDAPAGKHGFVTVDGNRFVFEDGTPARFWGLSLSNRGNFIPKEDAPAVARRIAKLGFNLVRLHHMDAPWCRPPTGLIDYSEGNSRNIDPRGLDRIDYLISCLKKEGIYVHLDMMVSRQFMVGDGVENADQMQHHGKGYRLFVPKLKELQKEYMRKLWTHKNPYTGLEYRNDPAIALTLITNENDHTTHHMIYSDKVEPYFTLYKRLVQEWADEQGHTFEEAFNNWSNPVGKRFVNEMMADFFHEMRAYMREIGVKVPVVGTNWIQVSHDLPAQASVDFMDQHTYGGTALDTSPHSDTPTMPARIATAHVLGKPLVISEYNEHWNVQERARMPLRIAAIGALQGWDGPTCFSYSGSPQGRIGDLYFGLDPAILSPHPAAALMFRRGDVARAERKVAIHLDENRLYDEVLNFKESMPAAYSTGVEKHQLVQALGEKPEVGAHGVDMVVEPKHSFLEPDADRAVSDTGEIIHDWERGVFFVRTPRAQVAEGRLKHYGPVSLPDARVTCSTDFAVIALSSLTDRPVSESDRVLLTAVARSQLKGMKWQLNGQRVAERGDLPTMAEPVEADIVLNHSEDALTVTPVRADGSRGAPLEVSREGDGFSFHIGPTQETIYYLIEAN
jgi:hypothetical protein